MNCAEPILQTQAANAINAFAATRQHLLAAAEQLRRFPGGEPAAKAVEELASKY